MRGVDCTHLEENTKLIGHHQTVLYQKHFTAILRPFFPFRGQKSFLRPVLSCLFGREHGRLANTTLLT